MITIFDRGQLVTSCVPTAIQYFFVICFQESFLSNTKNHIGIDASSVNALMAQYIVTDLT